MNSRRVNKINEINYSGGPVIYWMSRDQRAKDNWALIYAQETAEKANETVIVVFCLVPTFLNASAKHYFFMLSGLREIEKTLAEYNIPLYILYGEPAAKIPEFIHIYKSGCLITDFDPLRIKREWKNKINRELKIPFHEVNAHNIVPCWRASPKQEYGAYTIRKKIQKQLPVFLTDFPALKKQNFVPKERVENDWLKIRNFIQADPGTAELDWIKPGEKKAYEVLYNFIDKKLRIYDIARNDPLKDAQSNLSPYLHFGQISSQRIAIEINKSKVNAAPKEAFLDELIIRKELSDNFCYYNKNYDSFEGFSSWAQKTLNDHRNDKREYFYTTEELENGLTHDNLWNAAQTEMKKGGKMHGYLRMYWAKKILEWTKSPEESIKTAIYLNDTYSLDGRDPNGYAGIAWSIGGVHDRAWQERPVFGKIRFMSYNGCRSKFNVNTYISRNLT